MTSTKNQAITTILEEYLAANKGSQYEAILTKLAADINEVNW